MKKYAFLFICLMLVCCNNKVANISDNSDKKATLQLESNRYNVAFLIMNGTYNTELTAPFDIFEHTIFRDSIRAMNVFTVANSNEAISTFEGMRIIPDYNYIKE